SAGLDIEPNAADEAIEDIRIVDLTTRANQGAGLLIALGQLGPQSRSTIDVHQHTDVGSARPLELYAITPGAVRIRGTNWGDRAAALVTKPRCAFSLDASGLSPQLPSATLGSCLRDQGPPPPPR